MNSKTLREQRRQIQKAQSSFRSREQQYIEFQKAREYEYPKNPKYEEYYKHAYKYKTTSEWYIPYKSPAAIRAEELINQINTIKARIALGV